MPSCFEITVVCVCFGYTSSILIFQCLESCEAWRRFSYIPPFIELPFENVRYVESEITVERRDWYGTTKKRLLLLLWNGRKVRIKYNKCFCCRFCTNKRGELEATSSNTIYIPSSFFLITLLQCFFKTDVVTWKVNLKVWHSRCVWI